VLLFVRDGQSQGKIDGEMFFDYYAILKHHTQDLEGRHGFWVRRIYFTYSHDLSTNFKMRFRLEMASPGDFSSSDKLVPLVKDAYLSYEIESYTIMFGIIATPTWTDLENFWGYRCVEKTPLDLQGFGSSRDLGITLKGSFTSSKTVDYWIMYGDGASIHREPDNGKKGYALIRIKPMRGLFFDLYGDYEHQKDNKIYSVYQGFIGYEWPWGRLGVQCARRIFRQNDDRKDWTVFSAFSVAKWGSAIELVLRYDKMFDANPKGGNIPYIPFSDIAPSNLLIGAFNWKVQKNIWLIPNIKYVFYDTPPGREKPSEDVYLNLTVFFRY